MNSNLKALISFVLGGSIGATATYFVFKKREKKIMDEVHGYLEHRENIDSKKDEQKMAKTTTEDKPNYYEAMELIKDHIKNRENLNSEKTEITNEDRTNYHKIISEKNYKDPSDHIRVIPPEEAGEDEDFEVVELMYYADGILAYENDQMVKSPALSVGSDFASHFGEYEDDAVYIRNDELGMEYAILRSEKTYREVIKDKPYLLDNEEG